MVIMITTAISLLLLFFFPLFLLITVAVTCCCCRRRRRRRRCCCCSCCCCCCSCCCCYHCCCYGNSDCSFHFISVYFHVYLFLSSCMSLFLELSSLFVLALVLLFHCSCYSHLSYGLLYCINCIILFIFMIFPDHLRTLNPSPNLLYLSYMSRVFAMAW